MQRFIKYSLFIVLLFLIQSCSLLKVNLEPDTEPLDKEMVKTRNLTHSFVNTFFHDVRVASDSIFENTDSKEIQVNALLWKIIATQQAKNKVFQNNPEVALIDTWVLTATMADFLKTGIGNTMFKEQQIIATEASDSLLVKIDVIAKKAFESDYDNAKHFVDSIRQTEPFTSYDFYRETLHDNWYQYQKIPDSIANASTGTLAQVLSDFSTKFAIGGEQTLYQSQWTTELMLKKSNLDNLDLQKISDDFNKNLDAMTAVFKNSSIVLQKDAEVFHRDFRLLVKNLNQNLDSITTFASKEMSIFRDSIAVERKAIMIDLDATSTKIVKTAMEELKGLVKEILVYLIIILIIILLIPFSVGYITGKAMASKNNNTNNN